MLCNTILAFFSLDQISLSALCLLKFVIYGLDFSKNDSTTYKCKNSVPNFMRCIKNTYLKATCLERVSLEKIPDFRPSRKPKKCKLKATIVRAQNNSSLQYKVMITMTQMYHAFI